MAKRRKPRNSENGAEAPGGSGGGRLKRRIPGLRTPQVSELDALRVPRGVVAKSPPAPAERNERGFIDQPSGLPCCQWSHEDAPQRQICVRPRIMNPDETDPEKHRYSRELTCDCVMIPLPIDERRAKHGRSPIASSIPDLKST